MCSIVGIVSINGVEKYCSLVKNALKKNNYRGYNGINLYHDKNICFGYTKLAKRELNTKYNQPLFVNNTITFADGEVYRINDTNAFNDKSDIEPLVEQILLNKEKIYEYIDADFAMCTYDPKNNILLLARDFFGVKPLYYYWIDNYTLVFSSEIGGIKTIIDQSVSFDVETIRDYLIFGYPINNKTFYFNIKSFPAKTIFEWNLMNNKQKFYVAKDDYLKYTKNGSDISEAINVSVKDRVLSDRKIGAHLSGGLDSSLISYITKNNIEYFTAFNNAGDEDLYISNLISSQLKFNHYMIKLPYEYEYEKLIDILSSPIMSTGAFVPYEIAKVAASYNVKVLLEGQGADELFLGYKRFDDVKMVKSNQELVEILSNSDLKMLKELFCGYDFLKKYENIFKDKNFLLNAQKFYVDNFLAEILRIEEAVHMNFNIENKVPYLSLPVRKFISKHGINVANKNVKESLLTAHKKIQSKALLRKEKGNMNRSLLEELKKMDFDNVFENKIFENFNYKLLEEYLKKIDSLSKKQLFTLWTIYNINLWYKYNNFKLKIKV